MAIPQEINSDDELLDKDEISGDESWELLELSSNTISVDGGDSPVMWEPSSIELDQKDMHAEDTINEPHVAKAVLPLERVEEKRQLEARLKVEKEVWFIRHILQKGLLSQVEEVKPSAVKRCSDFLTRLEDLGDLDASTIRCTKIHTVLKAIRKVAFIPREDEFHLKTRALIILNKYLPLIEATNDKTAANSSNQANTSNQHALELTTVATNLAAPSVSQILPDEVLELPEPYYGSLLVEIKSLDLNRVRKLNCTRGTCSWTRRLISELGDFHRDKTLPYLSISPINDMPDNCLACMEGQPGSPFAGGVFWVHITHPANYPASPPTLRFLTPIYHPNIDHYGRICLDILEKAWSPILRTETVLLSVLSVLNDPFVDDPLVPEIAQKFVDDFEGYCEKARFFTSQYAKVTRPDTTYLVNMFA